MIRRRGQYFHLRGEKMFEATKYPIKVFVFRKYGNGIAIYDGRGRVLREKRRNIENNGEVAYKFFDFFIKVGRKKYNYKIPLQDISKFYNINDVATIYLYQMSNELFYPILSDDTNLIMKVPKYDDDGNLIGYDDVPIFRGDIELDNGEIVPIPHMIAQKTYDKDSWLVQQYHDSYEMYRSKMDFWSKYGVQILALVAILMTSVIFVYGSMKISEMHNKFADTFKNTMDMQKKLTYQTINELRNVSYTITQSMKQQSNQNVYVAQMIKESTDNMQDTANKLDVAVNRLYNVVNNINTTR